MKKLYAVFFFVVFSFSLSVSGQDFHLSQYDAAPMFLNPSLTGKFNGHYRLHGQYRTQWNTISSNPFTTALISFDQSKNKFAYGVQMMNSRAGTGDYNAMSFLGSLAYEFNLDKSGNHRLSIGAKGGMIQKSIKVSNLTFASQYTPANGGTFDTGIPSGEGFSNTSIILPDVNAGLTYFYGKPNSRVTPFVGGAVQHLIEPEETFFNANNTLPMRYIGHAGAKINISERIQVLPKGFFMYQQEAQEITYSLLGYYYLKDADAFLIFGPTYRNDDAAIIELGLKISRYTCRVSYDVNTSSLQPTTNGRGGFEISFTYIPIKQKPNPVPNCPRL